jgi:hypothetical protein
MSAQIIAAKSDVRHGRARNETNIKLSFSLEFLFYLLTRLQISDGSPPSKRLAGIETERARR